MSISGERGIRNTVHEQVVSERDRLLDCFRAIEHRLGVQCTCEEELITCVENLVEERDQALAQLALVLSRYEPEEE